MKYWVRRVPPQWCWPLASWLGAVGAMCTTGLQVTQWSILIQTIRIHYTLIAVDRYLRLMGDKTIPDSAEPRLESFYPPFIAGVDLPHQGVVVKFVADSYRTLCRGGSVSLYIREHVRLTAKNDIGILNDIVESKFVEIDNKCSNDDRNVIIGHISAT